MVKKQLIIEKSLELFAEQGFEATSVQQITDRCGISKGAFYLSFKSKDELIMAIIDSFMMDVTVSIDQSVRGPGPSERKLYDFYCTAFRSLSKHTGFAKVFIMEQALPLNEELLSKINEYDARINRSILYLLDQLYEEARDIRYDLLICVKGFLQQYIGIYLHHGLAMNLEIFADSLVEKTNILARHMTKPFVTEEVFLKMVGADSQEGKQDGRDRLIGLIADKLPELEDPIEIESLHTLKQSLLQTEPSMAIVKGMLENLRNNLACKWVCYLIREYYRL